MQSAATFNATPIRTRLLPVDGTDSPAFPAFLSHPFVIFYTAFMALMVAISFDIPAVSTLAYRLRWPVMGLVAVVGVLRALALPGFRTSRHYKYFIAFLTLATLTSIASIKPLYSFERSVSIWMLFCATGVGLCHYCMNRRNLIAFTDAVWCLGAVMTVAGFVFRGGDPDVQRRFGGLQNSATGAGTYAALFLPIALYQVRYRFGGLMAPIGWLVVALMVVQPVLASARTALAISFVVGAALCFDYYGRKAQLATAMLACLLPLALLIDTRTLLHLHDKADTVLRQKSIGNFTGRLERWKFGMEQWQRKPLIGHGFGASRYLAGIEDPRRFDLQPDDVFNWHSDQIEVLADLGGLGWLAFAAFWTSLGLTGLKVVAAPRSPARQLALAYLGTIAYTFVDTFMHGGFMAAGGGTSTYTWSFVAVFSAICLTHFAGGKTAQRFATRRRASMRSAHATQSVATPEPAAVASAPRELPSAKALFASRAQQVGCAHR